MSTISRILNGENVRQVIYEVSVSNKRIDEVKIKGISKLAGVCSWNSKFYGYIPDKPSYRYYKSDNARFDDSIGKTEEITADEYTEIYSKYAKVVLGRDVNEDREYDTNRYTIPKGPETELELDLIAKAVVSYLKMKENPTVEDVIERFRMMNDDYDDYWARGLRTKEQEKAFVNDILDRVEKYGVSVDDLKEAKKFKGSGKRINFEDDLVVVYDKDMNVVYKGMEDYEDLKDEDWKFDSSIGAYRFDDFIKDCIS